MQFFHVLASKAEAEMCHAFVLASQRACSWGTNVPDL
jgi:hypothetical protein